MSFESTVVLLCLVTFGAPFRVLTLDAIYQSLNDDWSAPPQTGPRHDTVTTPSAEETVEDYTPAQTSDEIGPTSRCSASVKDLEDKLRQVLHGLPNSWNIRSLRDLPDFLSNGFYYATFAGLDAFKPDRPFSVFCKGDKAVIQFNLVTSERPRMDIFRCYYIRYRTSIGSRTARVEGSLIQEGNCTKAGMCLRLEGVRVVQAEETRVEVLGTNDEEGGGLVKKLNFMFPQLVEQAWNKCLAQALMFNIDESLRNLGYA